MAKPSSEGSEGPWRQQCSECSPAHSLPPYLQAPFLPYQASICFWRGSTVAEETDSGMHWYPDIQFKANTYSNVWYILFFTGSEEAEERGDEQGVQANQWETSEDFSKEAGSQSCSWRSEVSKTVNSCQRKADLLSQLSLFSLPQ